MKWEQKKTIFSVIQSIPFLKGVGIFGLIFLSHFLTEMRSFCAHQKGNFLNFLKLTLLLFIVHFWYLLWPVKHKGAFFLRHPVPSYSIQCKSRMFQNVPECMQNLYLWMFIH